MVNKEWIEEAKALFRDSPHMTCKEVAKKVKVSETTLRRGLRLECIAATGRNLKRLETMGFRVK